MATFLTATDSSAAIERVIRTAKKELMLLSAYVYPRMIYLERLQDAAKRGVRISLVFGKRPLDEKVMKLFHSVDNITIYYLDVLHAKCFVNETEAVVTSLNLLNGSEEKNREMGVRLEKATDSIAYDECVEEVRSILSVAVQVYPSQSMTAQGAPLPKEGFCIRCGKAQPCDPDRPLCMDDFKSWVQYKNPEYNEQYCHTCGKQGPASMAIPLCASCSSQFAIALRSLDAKKDQHSVFYRNTWRRPLAALR